MLRAAAGYAVAGTAVKATTVNPLNLPKNTGATQGHFAIPFRSTHTSSSNAARSGNAPSSTAGATTSSGANLLHNFNGVSAVDSINVNGFDVEPPDQGLCVGNGYVVEPVNLALTIFHPTARLSLVPLLCPPSSASHQHSHLLMSMCRAMFAATSIRQPIPSSPPSSS